MWLLFLGSERICSTTTEGNDESETACSASNKLGVGALALVKRPRQAITEQAEQRLQQFSDSFS
jgi:hypothetical protein